MTRTIIQDDYEKYTILKAIINNKGLKGNGGLPEAIRIYKIMTHEERNNEVKKYISYGGKI